MTDATDFIRKRYMELLRATKNPYLAVVHLSDELGILPWRLHPLTWGGNPILPKKHGRKKRISSKELLEKLALTFKKNGYIPLNIVSSARYHFGTQNLLKEYLQKVHGVEKPRFRKSPV